MRIYFISCKYPSSLVGNVTETLVVSVVAVARTAGEAFGVRKDEGDVQIL